MSDTTDTERRFMRRPRKPDNDPGLETLDDDIAAASRPPLPPSDYSKGDVRIATIDDENNTSARSMITDRSEDGRILTVQYGAIELKLHWTSAGRYQEVESGAPFRFGPRLGPVEKP